MMETSLPPPPLPSPLAPAQHNPRFPKAFLQRHSHKISGLSLGRVTWQLTSTTLRAGSFSRASRAKFTNSLLGRRAKCEMCSDADSSVNEARARFHPSRKVVEYNWLRNGAH
jgi:hypothetical protein